MVEEQDSDNDVAPSKKTNPLDEDLSNLEQAINFLEEELKNDSTDIDTIKLMEKVYKEALGPADISLELYVDSLHRKGLSFENREDTVFLVDENRSLHLKLGTLTYIRYEKAEEKAENNGKKLYPSLGEACSFIGYQEGVFRIPFKELQSFLGKLALIIHCLETQDLEVLLNTNPGALNECSCTQISALQKAPPRIVQITGLDYFNKLITIRQDEQGKEYNISCLHIRGTYHTNDPDSQKFKTLYFGMRN